MSVSVAGRSGSGHEEFGRKEPTPFRIFAFATIGLNVVLLFTAATMTQAGSLVPPAEGLAWVALVALAGLVPLSSGKGPALAMDLPLLMAVAFVFDPFVSGVIAFLGVVDIREMRREISLARSVWNRSQTSLSVMTASLVFGALGQLGAWPATPLIAVLALAADAVVNYAMVGYGTSLRSGLRVREALAAMRIGSPRNFILTYACFGFLGILIAEAYAAFGLAGVVASVAPVVLGRQAFLHRSRLETSLRNLAASTDALRRVDERIAAERKDERARIAEALHDEVLQDLYNVTIRAQVLRQDLLAGRLLDLEDDLPAVVRASEAAVEDLREVIRGLRSATVGHAGLVETLALFTRHVGEESNTKIVTSLDSTVRSTPERELVVYQIAREALTNSIRHGAAKTIWISLLRSSEGCQVVVEDDGHGFDSDAPPSDLHFGLQLMRERAASISARLDVHSKPGLGTTVRLVFDC
jgi:signal transduction histidine kinase